MELFFCISNQNLWNCSIVELKSISSAIFYCLQRGNECWQHPNPEKWSWIYFLFWKLSGIFPPIYTSQWSWKSFRLESLVQLRSLPPFPLPGYFPPKSCTLKKKKRFYKIQYIPDEHWHSLGFVGSKKSFQNQEGKWAWTTRMKVF